MAEGNPTNGKNGSEFPGYYVQVSKVFLIRYGGKRGLALGAVYGQVWLYAKKKGFGYAAQDTIADDLCLTRATVNTHLNALVADGYLEDVSPENWYWARHYAPTNKLELEAVELWFGDEEGGVKKPYTPPTKKAGELAENAENSSNVDGGVKKPDMGCKETLQGVSGNLTGGVKKPDTNRLNNRLSSKDQRREEEAERAPREEGRSAPATSQKEPQKGYIRNGERITSLDDTGTIRFEIYLNGQWIKEPPNNKPKAPEPIEQFEATLAASISDPTNRKKAPEEIEKFKAFRRDLYNKRKAAYEGLMQTYQKRLEEWQYMYGMSVADFEKMVMQLQE